MKDYKNVKAAHDDPLSFWDYAGAVCFILILLTLIFIATI